MPHECLGRSEVRALEDEALHTLNFNPMILSNLEHRVQTALFGVSAFSTLKMQEAILMNIRFVLFRSDTKGHLQDRLEQKAEEARHLIDTQMTSVPIDDRKFVALTMQADLVMAYIILDHASGYIKLLDALSHYSNPELDPRIEEWFEYALKVQHVTSVTQTKLESISWIDKETLLATVENQRKRLRLLGFHVYLIPSEMRSRLEKAISKDYRIIEFKKPHAHVSSGLDF